MDVNGVNVRKLTHSLKHYQQRHNWDCGLSCVLMTLQEAQREQILQDLANIIDEEGFEQSTWTIDLCYLLKRFGLDFHYTTTTLGVDPGYSSQRFYTKLLHKDESRVQKRFNNAEVNRISVEERSCDMTEIIRHLAHKGPCIVLTNANLLRCEVRHRQVTHCRGHLSECFTRTLRKTYQGHYIILVGFDLDRQKIIYRNPTFRDRECEMSLDCLEEARTDYGTDEDVIFINLKP